ncbi:hypothetical protein JJC00_22230 [Bradyrhizobium diazoefficiens]|uniref:hypothetical protein n=1 Tax=Bradyrhizobium diazoefficiens TaxID=1355477 RepID=UPI00190AABEA|nr:hypothetical protein [Bradyrhizobium diazoefficiens]QQO31360.1 hypothetical protein JJC00_22230 [Bradyrhizobium diazoefficiens]
MKTILGRQYAAPTSSAAICKTTIKEITLVLNGGTHVARDEEFFRRRILSQRVNTRHEMERAKCESSLHLDCKK